MANVTLQSFNVFLTERLTAAAVDIYGFFEKAVLDYQEEVYRTKLENQRLQRLLDMVYNPQIRLRRADSIQFDLSTPTQEVCVQQELGVKTKCIPTEVREEPVVPACKEEWIEPWSGSVEAAAQSSYSGAADVTHAGEHEENTTRTVSAEHHDEFEVPDGQARVATVGDHLEYNPTSHRITASQPDQALPSFGQRTSFLFCRICRRPFLREVDLKLHLEDHAATRSPSSPEKGYSCAICGKKTCSQSQMICHMRSHTGEKPFSCPVCGNRYRLKGHVKEHLRTHTGERPYTCYVCGRTFNRSSTMSKHARNRHRENTPFKCSHCNQCFAQLLLMKRHKKAVHDHDAERPNTPMPEVKVHNQEPDWCRDERKEEPGPSQIRDEQQKAELWINGSEEQLSEEDSDGGDSLTKELIKTVQQLEDSRAAEEGKNPTENPEEDEKHSGEKMSTTLYRCHICNFIFTKKTVLTWHLKTHESKPHDSRGNFDCHICGKQIPCQSNLQNHMRVHTGERPYSCHFCGKCFKLKGHMTEHIRTHTGEKPFSCHVCGKSFNRGSTLRKHVLAKHKEERPYKCEDCKELFTERLLMKRHMRKVHGVKLSTSQSPV
ncbi:zinc finger protein ZFP2-like [Brachionichthys hirsutus]|uniref:zinc finger protein ZFP2-like n=1 Tax=Brachionichthys hirsutus TaxID=412623 RepID=UPI003604A9B5